MAGLHEEYRYTPEGADTAVIFVHGILGSPSQFTYLVDSLGSRITVANLLLPGHGGTVRDFARSGMAAWQSHVDACVAELAKTHRDILLVGHSMGCLLSVQAALTYPDHIRGLFMLAMPLVIRVPSPAVINRMKGALGGDSGQDYAEWRLASEEAGSVSALRQLDYLPALPRFLELFIKSRKTRRLVARVAAPIFAVHSEFDETVSPRSLRYIEGLPGAAVMIARDSGHFYYPEQAKLLISDALARFMEATCGAADMAHQKPPV
jgi:carboxylesterase